MIHTDNFKQTYKNKAKRSRKLNLTVVLHVLRISETGASQVTDTLQQTPYV